MKERIKYIWDKTKFFLCGMGLISVSLYEDGKFLIGSMETVCFDMLGIVYVLIGIYILSKNKIKGE